MLLNNITVLSAFPNEFIQINLNPAVAPAINVRFGLRFRSTYWNNTPNIFNFAPFSINQAGAEPLIYNNPDLAPLFNLAQTDQYFQPNGFTDIPSDFPVFATLSGYPYHDLSLTFVGGPTLSSISIFPSRPYPKITKTSSTGFTVSGTFFNITGVDSAISRKNYLKTFDENTLTNLEDQGASILFESSFKSAHKENFVLYQNNQNNSTGIVIDRSTIPANTPYDRNIIPESFLLTLPVSASTGLNTETKYLSFLQMNNGVAELTSVKGNSTVKAAVLSAILYPSLGELSVVLEPDNKLPFGSNIIVSYETSSYYPVNVSAPSINTVDIDSVDISPYLLNYNFSLSTSNTDIMNAFNISFSPSSTFLNTGSFSSVSLSTVMVDNYNQIYFPIISGDIIVKFTDATSDSTLSAIDAGSNRLYVQNTWIPASANLIFVNNGFINQHSVILTFSAVNNSIWEYELPYFFLNRDKLLMGISVLSSTDLNIDLLIWSFPYSLSESEVVWSISPSENLVVTNGENLDVIPLDTPVELTTSTLHIENLGVNDTTISMKVPLFGQEYVISTVWKPTSASFIGNTIALSASPVNDFNEIKTSSISALMKKGNFYYLCPYDGLISWSETLITNPAIGSTQFYESSSNNIIYQGSVYPAIRSYDIVNTKFNTSNALNNPQNITFNIKSIFVHKYAGSQTAELQFNIRQYPAYKPMLYASLSSLSGISINTGVTDSWTFTNTDVITAIALLSAFHAFPESNVRWTLPDTSVVSGISAVFALTSDFCLSVSALSARPKAGGFGDYNFVDTICLYYSPSLSALDYISFPEKIYFPEKTLTLSNYNDSPGLTALSGCGAQTIVLSTYGGFDEYHYRIGTKTLSSTFNIFRVPVTVSDVATSSSVSISAFSARFPRTNPLTVYNYVSSDNSNIFKQNIRFVNTPHITPILTIDTDMIDLDFIASTFFTPTITYPNSSINITSGNYVFVLSSVNGVRVDTEIHDISDTTNLYQFTPDVTDFFSISANTFNVFSMYVSGTMVKSPNTTCNISQPFFSTSVTLSVFYSKPNLQIFIPQNIHETNTIIYFTNKTDKVLPVAPDSFTFDDGAGNLHHTVSYLTPLTGIYANEGTYSVTLSAFYDGNPAIRTWTNFITIKNNFTDYNEKITRQFPDELELIYDCADFSLTPNSWQTAAVLNATFDKINTNIEFLSAMSTAFNIQFPKNYIGYWSKQTSGIENWIYDTIDLPAIAYNNFKHGVWIDNRLILINGNTLELRNYDYNLSLVTIFTNINEGELLISPSHIVYNSVTNKIIVLDSAQKLIYVFIFENDELTFTHYWGGAGEKNSRTKLNNPVDLHIDDKNNIYIVDKDSLIIKCYNAFLNWIYNVTHAEWTKDNAPISSATSTDKLFVLTTANKVYIFEKTTLVSSFAVLPGTAIVYDRNHSGLIYIISDTIHSYAENGTFINSFHSFDTGNINELLFYENEIFSLTNNSLFKFINFVDYFSILGSGEYTAQMWAMSSLYISPNEAVTDFVLNDSFKKIHDNMLLFAKDISRKFIVYSDEYGEFIRQDNRLIQTAEIMLSAISFESIGLNEMVSYDVLARSYNNICSDLMLLKEMVENDYEQLPLSAICWTWKFHKIAAPQNINNNVRPYSWVELVPNNIFQPELSAITWDLACGCCGESNDMPICWIWEELACDCIFPKTWAHFVCSENPNPCDDLNVTWESKTSPCCLSPKYYFDNCDEPC